MTTRREETTMEDHKQIIQAKLTGQPFPTSVYGKIENPMFNLTEEAFLTDEVKEELTEKGYKEDNDGIWRNKEKIVKIIVMRHPEKDGDCITPLGAQQAFAAGQNLKDLGYNIDRIFYSGAQRTFQASLVTAAGLNQCELRPEENQCFNFGAAVQSAYDGDSQSFIDELTAIKKAGNKTIKECCDAGGEKFNNYVKTAGKNLTEGMVAIAEEMIAKVESTALALSHSPYTETATLNPKETPMGLGESDAIEYVIQNGEIISNRLIPAPIAGKTNA